MHADPVSPDKCIGARLPALPTIHEDRAMNSGPLAEDRSNAGCYAAAMIKEIWSCEAELGQEVKPMMSKCWQSGIILSQVEQFCAELLRMHHWSKWLTV